MAEVDENIIRDVTDEIYDGIRTCGIMSGDREKEDCSSTCDYYKICKKIFEKVADMEE